MMDSHQSRQIWGARKTLASWQGRAESLIEGNPARLFGLGRTVTSHWNSGKNRPRPRLTWRELAVSSRSWEALRSIGRSTSGKVSDEVRRKLLRARASLP